MNKKLMLFMVVAAAIVIPSVAYAEVAVSTTTSVSTTSTATSVVTIQTASNYPQANAAGYLTLGTTTSGATSIALNGLAGSGTIAMANVLELMPSQSGNVTLGVTLPAGVTMVISPSTQAIVTTSSGVTVGTSTGLTTGSITAGVLSGALHIAGSGTLTTTSSFTVTAGVPVMIGFVLNNNIGANTGSIVVSYNSG